MTQPARLWIETTHHAAFRYGGWGFVREEGGAVSGQAGGERNITAARIDLLALIAALQGLAPAAAVTITSSSPGVVVSAHVLAAPGSQGAPAEDLDLWAQALKLCDGRTLTVRLAQRTPATPAAFCFAWAEVGQDKAKGKGRFSAAIPRPNLARLALA
jgi:hypothetical protein